MIGVLPQGGVGGSFNGRTADSGSADWGSNPYPPVDTDSGHGSTDSGRGASPQGEYLGILRWWGRVHTMPAGAVRGQFYGHGLQRAAADWPGICL